MFVALSFPAVDISLTVPDVSTSNHSLSYPIPIDVLASTRQGVFQREMMGSKVLILLNSKCDMQTAGKLIKGFMSHYGSQIKTNVT